MTAIAKGASGKKWVRNNSGADRPGRLRVGQLSVNLFMHNKFHVTFREHHSLIFTLRSHIKTVPWYIIIISSYY
jgi:hypothetical protein